MATILPTHEPELTGPVDLCDANGRLNRDAVGWSRTPLHDCNVSGHTPRKKRWNYWAVHDDRILFSATIADVDHYVLAFVYFLEFETQRFIERTAILGPGSLELPSRVRESVRSGSRELSGGRESQFLTLSAANTNRATIGAL